MESSENLESLESLKFKKKEEEGILQVQELSRRPTPELDQEVSSMKDVSYLHGGGPETRLGGDPTPASIGWSFSDMDRPSCSSTGSRSCGTGTMNQQRSRHCSHGPNACNGHADESRQYSCNTQECPRMCFYFCTFAVVITIFCNSYLL